MEMNADDKELHALEEEFNTDIVPGTEIFRDTSDHHFIKSGTSDRVLVPQPTTDPHDPLNWSTSWKIAAFIAASWVTFTQGFGPLALAPMFPYYEKSFNVGLADAEQFTGVAILVLGFSNLIWVPISTAYGRRVVYIVTQIINIGATIWRARATSYNSFLGACILNGIASGPGETIQLAVIADIFFLHDRGKWNTLYWCILFGSLMVGPIISGPMSEYVGWRNFWWLFLGMLILSLIMVIFMFPETKYARGHPEMVSSFRSSSISDEKMPSPAEIANRRRSKDPYSNEPAQAVLGKGKPAKWQWRFYQPCKNQFRTLLFDVWIPWKLFIFPIVQFASFVTSWSASVFLTLNLTQSQAFGAGTSYNLSSTDIGFLNFAILIGAFIGLFTGGPFSDWVAMRLTIRNKGIREPEMRLPAMIPFVLIMILGNVVVAVGYANSWPWPAIVVIGYTCAGIQVAAIPSVATTYAVDSYKPVASSLMVSVTVNKNVWGYGLSKFLTPWSEQPGIGFVPPIMLNMGLATLWCSFGFLFYFYGKTFRRWSAQSSVHSL